MFDALEILLVRQICLQQIDLNACLAAQASGQLIHPVFIARHQHEVMAAMREPVGVGRANSRGCAGDEDCGYDTH